MSLKEPINALKYILKKLTKGNKKVLNTLAENFLKGIRGIKHTIMYFYIEGVQTTWQS